MTNTPYMTPACLLTCSNASSAGTNSIAVLLEAPAAFPLLRVEVLLSGTPTPTMSNVWPPVRLSLSMAATVAFGALVMA